MFSSDPDTYERFRVSVMIAEVLAALSANAVDISTEYNIAYLGYNHPDIVQEFDFLLYMLGYIQAHPEITDYAELRQAGIEGARMWAANLGEDE